ncbi:MAG: DUF2344 domain-containing protein [Firmicutes bacterium]|nr:DUF2344 domain-containing protein [Bacillota bacterium]
MKIRAKFTKGAPVRFISHLDLARTIERGVRRGQIPIAYSQGFNPRAKIAFGSALAVGVTSSGEYIDLELIEDMAIDDFLSVLNQCLPTGIEFTDAVEISPDTPTLMSVIDRASYVLTGDLEHNANLGQEVQNLLNNEAIWVERLSKKGTRRLDIRPWIFSVDVLSEDLETSGVSLLVQTGNHGNVRPEEVAAHLPFEQGSLGIHREGLFIARGAGLSSPLEVAHC